MPSGIFDYPHLFPLESGASLPGFRLSYETGGSLNAQRDNVIWVCHALTGNAHAPDWWPGLFGEGEVFDENAYFWVCANMLGSCYGSTYALSTNPETGEPWYHDFPLVTHCDIVRAFDLLREHLNISQVFLLTGGSTGGQHVLEWAILRPDVFKHIVPIATNAWHSPWGIAYNESQRMAIAADSTWVSRDSKAGLAGMRAARAIALLSYRSYETYQISQSESEEAVFDDFRAASYQRYQGLKLEKRFDAFAYWTLSKAMDSHHVGRGRGGAIAALGLIRAKTLVIGVRSDQLFPIHEQEYLSKYIPGSSLRVIESPYGHDGFLIEFRQLSGFISEFLQG